MKSPPWLSRISHGFILQGTDNNRLYSGNHVTIISKISPRTGDCWAGLEKLKFFSFHSKSCLLNPYPFDVPHVIIYLYYILFSHSSTPRNTHRDQKPQNTMWRQFWRDLQMPGVCTDVWSSRVCQWYCMVGTKSNGCCSHTGGVVERDTNKFLPLAVVSRSTPVWRIQLGWRLSRLSSSSVTKSVKWMHTSCHLCFSPTIQQNEVKSDSAAFRRVDKKGRRWTLGDAIDCFPVNEIVCGFKVKQVLCWIRVRVFSLVQV